jgi:hypothetical protein
MGPVGRTVQAIILVASLIVVAGGAFYAGNSLVEPPTKIPRTTPTAILEEAKKRVPEPVLPPKPAGREVVTMVDKPIEVDAPEVEWRTRELGLGLKTKVPEVAHHKNHHHTAYTREEIG